MILNLIPISLIGSGIYSTYLTFIKKNELDDKIKNCPIYSYPNELNKIPKTNSLHIIKISTNQIDSNYLIGEISLEKITPIIYYKKKLIKTDYFSNKYENVLVEKKLESRELIKKQILFPLIYNGLYLDRNLLLSNKIQILFDNTIVTKLKTNVNYKVLFDLYENDIKKNISTYYLDLIPNVKYNQFIELKKNYLDSNKDLYLIVNKNDNTNPNISEETNQLIDPDLIWVEPEYDSKHNVPVFLSENFEHNAKFVTVNSLDICHIGFVHTFGNKKKPNPLLNSKIIKLNDSSFHYKIIYDYLAGSNSIVNKIYSFDKIKVENEYVLPHTTVARVLFGNFTSTIVTTAQPISKFKTRLFVKAYRSYWFYNLENVPLFLLPFYKMINIIGDMITYKTMFTTLKQDKFIVDNIDKTDYEFMNGKFSIKYDMMSTHYKNNYRKYLTNNL